ncbi:dual specificity protein kinase Kns1p [Trichomonascus vanleenenianus]|uniref:serine/threonine protein kinase KNS1 n=1 Tax=Trichomonascus vanleenenianus TaxID=2268995 RepID=UPI003EC9A608
MSYFTDLPGMEPSLFYNRPAPPLRQNQLAYPLPLPSPNQHQQQPYHPTLLSYNYYWADNNNNNNSPPACWCSLCSASSSSSNASMGSPCSSSTGSGAYHHHYNHNPQFGTSNAPATLSASSLHNLQQTPASPPYQQPQNLLSTKQLFAFPSSTKGHSLWSHAAAAAPLTGDMALYAFNGGAGAGRTGTPILACAGTMDHPPTDPISRPTPNNEITQFSCYGDDDNHDQCKSKPDYCAATVTPAMSSATAANNNYGVWTPSQTPQRSHHQRAAAVVVAAPPMVAPPPPPQPRQTNQRKRKKGAPNWDDFYRNGYPAEIIVISDDEEPRVAKTQFNHTSDVTASGYSSLSSTAELKSVGSYSHTGTADFEDEFGGYNDDIGDSVAIKRRKRNNEPSDYEYRQRAHIPMPLDGTSVTANGVVSGGLQPPLYVPPKQPIVKPSDVYVRPINERRRKNAASCDDENGHYVVRENAEFADRYVIAKLLGQGTFGRVVSAYDKKSKTHCAIKIIRAIQKYRDASRTELRVLTALSRYDRENHNKCIHLRECFDYKNHICIVTDLLGISVFDFMHSNRFLPFPGSHIQSFARQLLQSVSFLHDLTLVHTDLKPENILLIDDSFEYAPFSSGSYYRGDDKKRRKVLRNTSIHLIDFGSAIFNDEHHSGVVSTRHYRAPEIVLGVGWSFPCDIWSLGCILVELYTGQTLFDTHDDIEHLALMEKIIGRPMDFKIATQACQGAGKKFFKKDMRIDYPNANLRDNSQQMVAATKTIEEIITREPSYRRHRVFWDSFLDLLRRIFVYDPRERITARQALNHPWLQMSIRDEGSDSILT